MLVILGFEVTEGTINIIPDSIPSYMGVCVVRYLDRTGTPYRGYFGRPHSTMGTSYDPISPISVSDSIYGGVMAGGIIRDRAMLFGYPGKYEVPFMFRLNYRNYWHYEHPYIVYPFVDTLTVSITANCTTYVDAALPWSPKVLIEDWYVTGETIPAVFRGIRGKVSVVGDTQTEDSIYILTYSNSFLFNVMKHNSNYTSYENSISLTEGYHDIEVVSPHLHSIRIDSVEVQGGEETLLTIVLPEKEEVPSDSTIETLLEYPDEWVSHSWSVSTIATLRTRPDEEKSGNLIGLYFCIDPESKRWRLVSVFRNGVFVQESAALPEWYPSIFYVSDVLSISDSGEKLLLNIVNYETVKPSLLSMLTATGSTQLLEYENLSLGRFGYPSYREFSVEPQLRILSNGSYAFIDRDFVRIYSEDSLDIVWEVDSLPDYACGLNRVVQFSKDATKFVIANRHTRLNAPLVIIDLQGVIQEIPELSGGRVELLNVSNNLDTLIYRNQDDGSLYHATRSDSSSGYSKSSPFLENTLFARAMDNATRFIIGTTTAIEIYNSPWDNDGSLITQFPATFGNWKITGISLLDEEVVVFNLCNNINQYRHIALSMLNNEEAIWISPIRSSYTNSIHPLRILSNDISLDYFVWNDGLIRLMKFERDSIQNINLQQLNSAELPL